MKVRIRGKRIERERDFGEFLKVLRREGRPDYLPFYEHVANATFISSRMGVDVRKLSGRAFWEIYVDFWLGMGFDCIPMEVPLRLKMPPPKMESQGGGASRSSESGACVDSREDLDAVEWPPEDEPIDFGKFEIVASLIPEGVKIVGGVRGGPFEWATQSLLGLAGLSYALMDDPELVGEVFSRLGVLYVGAVRRLASMDAVGACRQGDDLGFKTSTFLPPDVMREHIFPIYKGMCDAAHAEGKPFALHSCGNLEDVYEDLIECGVDAKHSFEDQILPVAEFKKRYGNRMTALGGLDVDTVCRSDEAGLRAYARKAIEECFVDGHWAMGTGNSLAPYMPVENYLIVLDEAIKITG